MPFRNPVTGLPIGLDTNPGGARIAIGSGTALPTALAAHLPTGSAVVFFNLDGSYYAIASSDNAGNPKVQYYYGASDLASPVLLSQDVAVPATGAATFSFLHNVQMLVGPLGQSYILPILPRTALSFFGSWTNAGGGYAAAGYEVDATGWVKLQGLVQNPSGGAVGSPITQLPAPADGAAHAFPVVDFAGGGHWIAAGATGVLTLAAAASAAGAGLPLDGIGYQS